MIVFPGLNLLLRLSLSKETSTNSVPSVVYWNILRVSSLGTDFGVTAVTSQAPYLKFLFRCEGRAKTCSSLRTSDQLKYAVELF